MRILARRTTHGLLLGAALLALAATPVAAQSINGVVFQPSPFGGDMLTLKTTNVPGDLAFTVGLDFHYTKAPLAFQGEDPHGRIFVEQTIKSRTMGELLLSFAPIRFIDIGLAVPLVLGGEGTTVGFTGGGDTGGFHMGEMRFLAKGVPYDGDLVGFAVVASATFPTADDEAMAGSGFGGGAELVVDFDFADRFNLALNVGGYFRAEAFEVGTFSVQHDLTFGLGGDVRIIDGLHLIGEAYARTNLLEPFAGDDLGGSMLEFLGGVRYSPLAGLSITAGGGGGTPLVTGWGTSQARAFLDVRYTLSPVDDTDGDGVSDVDDECEIFPEDVDGFQDDDGCPDPDNDGDGHLDGDDKCPDEAEDFDDHEDGDGCPDTDNDGDTIPDAVDRCPDIPETVNSFKDDDGCPDFPGISEEDGRILLSEKLLFHPKLHDVAPESFEILRNLARFLESRPDWKRIRVDVHHFTKKPKANKLAEVTRARGQALLRFLVTEGIAPSRLEIRSVGGAEPIGDGRTPAGIAANERVEFYVVATE